VSGRLKVSIEVGPKSKKCAAFVRDWPGLERGGKSEVEAVETLREYLPRYAKIAGLARMGREFDVAAPIQIVERYEGIGSTDYWAISFASSKADYKRLSSDELKRELTLLRACWRYFDDVRGIVSPTMRKGPRGGGRDRDRIVQHVFNCEADWAKKVGVRFDPEGLFASTHDVKSFRDELCRSIRSTNAQGAMARSWPLRFLIRHTAYHVLDHTWEMQDKDMSANT
jgi:hypothetical protein